MSQRLHVPKPNTDYARNVTFDIRHSGLTLSKKYVWVWVRYEHATDGLRWFPATVRTDVYVVFSLTLAKWLATRTGTMAARHCRMLCPPKLKGCIFHLFYFYCTILYWHRVLLVQLDGAWPVERCKIHSHDKKSKTGNNRFGRYMICALIGLGLGTEDSVATC